VILITSDGLLPLSFCESIDENFIVHSAIVTEYGPDIGRRYD